jgi:hypothetical protein
MSLHYCSQQCTKEFYSAKKLMILFNLYHGGKHFIINYQNCCFPCFAGKRKAVNEIFFEAHLLYLDL